MAYCPPVETLELHASLLLDGVKELRSVYEDCCVEGLTLRGRIEELDTGECLRRAAAELGRAVKLLRAARVALGRKKEKGAITLVIG